jgi:predicted DNA-binding ribbon-helix-helix protein
MTVTKAPHAISGVVPRMQTIARTQGGALMCRVFAEQDPESYRVVTRSVRLNGYSTSIRLEAMFWSILDEIAASQSMSTPRFISTLYDEVMELRGEVGNFASLLRVTCTGFVRARQEPDAAPAIGNGKSAGSTRLPPRVHASA